MKKGFIGEIQNILTTSLAVLILMVLIPFFIVGNANAEVKNNDDVSKEVNSKVKTTIDIQGGSKAKVYNMKTKKVMSIDVEEYILGVVGGEMPANFELEALKAQAIAARTYYYARRLNHCSQGNGAEICNTIHCQVYVSKNEREKTFADKESKKKFQRIVRAVEDTKGEILVFNDELVMYPQFFSTSSGKTERCLDVFAKDVPYLQSVESKGEEIAPRYKSEVEFDKGDIVTKINNEVQGAKLTKGNLTKELKILSRTKGGGVNELKIGKVKIKGTEARKILGLNSANFTIKFKGNKVIFNCKGYGHGVGMSQWGANVMAKKGKNYKDILRYYYQGVDIRKVKSKK